MFANLSCEIAQLIALQALQAQVEYLPEGIVYQYDEEGILVDCGTTKVRAVNANLRQQERSITSQRKPQVYLQNGNSGKTSVVPEGSGGASAGGSGSPDAAAGLIPEAQTSTNLGASLMREGPRCKASQGVRGAC